MKLLPVFLVLSGVAVLVLADAAQDYEEGEVWSGADEYRPTATTRRPTTPPRRPGTPPRRPGTTTRRPGTTAANPGTTAANPGIDGNGQLIGCPCVSTAETNLVCGTDGNTYGNMGKLRCAQRCGHRVEVNFQGNCRVREKQGIVPAINP